MTTALIAAGAFVLAGITGGLAATTRTSEGVLARAGTTLRVAGIGLGASHLRLRLMPLAKALGGLAGGWYIAGLAGAAASIAAVFVLPVLQRRRRRERHRELVEDQLAEAATCLAEAMRAGFSVSQAIRFSGEESDPPLRDELLAVVERESMGVPLGEALGEWASRSNRDGRLFATVLRLHNRTGGDLPVVLDQLARTLSERRAASREIRSLTAQARLSGAILGLLPIVFFLFLSVISREDMEAAYRSPLGIAAILLGVLLQGIAFVWIRRLLRVEP